MPDTHNRVAIDRIDWANVFPVLRLVSAFRHALQPGKLMVALIAVLLIHFSGTVLDLIWVGTGDKTGIYETIIAMQGMAFSNLMLSALSLELGIGGATAGVVGALYEMFVRVPGWAFSEYPWFTIFLGLDTLVVLGFSSGVICRMAATQVCQQQGTSLPSAVRFVARRWAWYLITPLMPTLLILLFGGVLILAGLLLFNIAFLEIIGSLGYGLLLMLGFVIALVSVLLVFALCLMPPALSVEGSDGFDAIARAFNYVMFRPWQFAGYLVGAVVYASVVYVLVAALAGLTAAATQTFVDVGAINTVSEKHESSEAVPPAEHNERDATRYRAITADSDQHGVSISVSAWMVHCWLDLLGALVIAVMFSVVCCLQTQVYVLMRRSADGTPLDQLTADDQDDLWADEPDAAQAPAPDPSSAGD